MWVQLSNGQDMLLIPEDKDLRILEDSLLSASTIP